MKYTPQQFRESIAATRATGGRCIAVSLEDALVLADAVEIADVKCRGALIEHCMWTDETLEWTELGSERESARHSVHRAVSYLDARGLIERHPEHQHWVRMREAG